MLKMKLFLIVSGSFLQIFSCIYNMVSVSYLSVLGFQEDISGDILFGTYFSGYLGTTCLRIYKFFAVSMILSRIQKEFIKSFIKSLYKKFPKGSYIK